ncbi:SCO family protein [Psychromonas antarctica]|jgi:protein SCO1/2|uniref:SCO family protein n=1 Tax=Psychromonas antarctica TaxID=67573 RepID=UPI001EE7FE24|nr:SCO family protein [Psychromonas antarctica]MCG6200088.1 SCO family protein [Psychromonas antarctica]
MKSGVLLAFIVLFTSFFLLGKMQANPGSSSNKALLVQQKGKILPPFSFVISTDKTFSNQDLLNRWTLFFIGYTYCPDICPTTLMDLNRIYPALVAPPYSNIQVVFVSVDPNRDQADHLTEYVHYFNPHFKGVTGTHQQLFPFAQNLGLVYSIVDQPLDKYYLIDHSASLVLINPRGEHHATFKAELNKDGIAHVDMDLMVEDIHQIYQNWQENTTSY